MEKILKCNKCGHKWTRVKDEKACPKCGNADLQEAITTGGR